MKIKVESAKIVKALKKLEGIEVVLENAEDAKEALHLILVKSGLSLKEGRAGLRDVAVSSTQKYEPRPWITSCSFSLNSSLRRTRLSRKEYRSSKICKISSTKSDLRHTRRFKLFSALSFSAKNGPPPRGGARLRAHSTEFEPA